MSSIPPMPVIDDDDRAAISDAVDYLELAEEWETDEGERIELRELRRRVEAVRGKLFQVKAHQAFYGALRSDLG